MNLLAEADRLALNELHILIDCVQSDLSINTDELNEIHPNGTLGQTLKELIVEYVSIKSRLNSTTPQKDLTNARNRR